MKKEAKLALLGILLIAVLFVLSSYFIQTNEEYFTNLLGDNLIGIFIYLLIIVLEIVLAPVTVIPFIPIATNQWGWLATGALTLVGWTFGSLLAFLIARKFGVPIMKKFVSLEKVYQMEKLISKKSRFFGIVILRLTIPIDLISYAIGLFTRIEWKKYTLATAIGFAPLAFALAYLGELPFYYQIFLIATGIIIFLVIVLIKFSKKNFKKI